MRRTPVTASIVALCIVMSSPCATHAGGIPTDLAISVGGVPVNMPTHELGQVYTDIDFVIPELVNSVEYRYSLGLDWTAQLGRGEVHALAYAIDYGLDLFSNFTYALDPENGDQFEQLDDRRMYGGAASWRRSIGPSNDLALGAQWRRDDIDAVGVEPRTVRVTLTGSF